MNFDYSLDYLLETQHVQLEPLKESHFEQLVPVADDPVIWEFLWEDCRKEDQLRQYINQAVSDRRQEVSYPFVIIDKAKQRIVGTTRLTDIHEQFNHLKIGHTWYGSAYRGTGINKVVKYLLFQFVFDQMGADRIGFGVHEKNKRSMAALKSVGCKEEGVLREYLPEDRASDCRIDVVMFSILKVDWESQVKAQLKSLLQKMNQ